MTEYQVDWTSQHAPTWLRYLGKFAGQPCYGLEIGCYEGRSTVWFCENILTYPSSLLTCVDPFDPDTQRVQHLQEAPLSRFLENTKSVFRKIFLYNYPSARFWIRMAMPYSWYDWIYVDGSHELVHTSTDMVMGWETLKRGGIMIIDDYMEDRDPGEQHFHVRDAVNNFIKVYNPKVHELGFQAVLEKE